MPLPSLIEDQFRLLAYVRAYSDRREQHLDPTWAQDQLGFSLGQLQQAARGLAEEGLAEFFEFEPPKELLRKHPELTPGPMPCDIQLTVRGWDYLRPARDA